ncbi:MAG: 3-dehydroquinate synthase [Bacteroidales bacterium]|nr:3-dehydroquinate synthase [Candidatus Colicola faecequi]
MIITSDIDLALREQTALISRNQLFILTDCNTAQHCLPIVQQTLELPAEQILTLPAGEEHKTLQSVEAIWQFLMKQGATRHSMLICLGGGVITDMGGFAAATYMRGMQFLNIPTTLLGMVDAAAGGKTGFDYAGMKNQIGLFRMPKETIIHTPFLRTLHPHQVLSGFAEMLKHALISSPLELMAFSAFDIEQYLNRPTDELQAEFEELISRSIDIKNYIVESDPEETGMRQTLNFGHTVGHALEAYALEAGEPLLHGYAVLYGIIAELYLSHMKHDFPERDIQQVISIMKHLYGKYTCPCKSYDRLIELMQHDKKNLAQNQITFTLLRTVGNYRLNCVCTPEEIKEALDFLFNC